MQPQIDIYDVTLRDGAQGPGIKFSAEDQLRVVKALDDFGAAFVEGGQPGSNPKAAEFFERARDMDLKSVKLAAFGSTRHASLAAERVNQIQRIPKRTTPMSSTARSSTTPVVHDERSRSRSGITLGPARMADDTHAVPVILLASSCGRRRGSQ